MPECDRCGDAHATVNPAEWVNDSVMLCPACWADLTDEGGWMADRPEEERKEVFSIDDD